jgi:hypothetical protein
MIKKKNTWPQYVKNSRGAVTEIYLPIDVYQNIREELEDYETIQKKEGIKWVQVPAKKKVEKTR